MKTTGDFAEKTLQCPTYAGPMYLPYSHPKPVQRRPLRVAVLPAALEEQPRATGATARASRVPLQPFTLSAVRLEASSVFGVAQRTNAAFLRKLDPDRLLFFFRRLANLRQPKAEGLVPYGGWESQGSGLRGEFIGHYLHAAAAVAVAAPGDELLRTRCEYIVRVLEECQLATPESEGYLSAFPQREFAEVEELRSRAPWVPYYVMHKLLAGLITTSELLHSEPAIRVAVRLAEHLRTRVHRLLAKGLDVWHDFINQEVGGMSEALADLARVTGNSTWLQLAGMFERPCFVGPLARGAPADAIERVHANTHLPQLLGAMARYEATGEAALRAAAENFWAELSSKHTFATGSSTTGEVWLRAGQLGDAVSHQRKENYWAHDQAETCVAHNSMRVSRRLLQWSPRSAWSRKGAHAAYYERTLYNAVLGTQRGTRPGQMLYMFPMGSGVSKAGIPNAPQGHHWSDDEHHFWCCQGSGIEAFARLADAIYWRHEGDSGADAARAGGDVTPHELLVLQLLPSELIWAEAGLRVRIHGDYAGSIVGGLPLRMSATFERSAQLPAAVGAKALEAKALGAKEPTSPGSARRVDVWLRLPAWANGLRVDLSGALKRAETSPPPSTTDSSSSSSSSTPTAATAAPAAGQMLPLQLPADGGSGSVALEFTPAVSWERIKDDRPHFASLHACIYGPLVLGGLTYAERALPARSVLTPVPQAARSQIASIRVLTPDSGGNDGKGGDGCLVSRWQSVWVIRPDGTRHFLPRPPSDCLARATPIEDELSRFAQAAGGGKGYAFDAAETRAACARFDGCLLPEGRSAFASGHLVMMHLGANAQVVLAAPPPVVEGSRKGGTDAANAATWRWTTAPIGIAGAATASSDHRGADSDGASFLEAFDMPGYVLAPSQATPPTLHLVRASASDLSQRWRRVRSDGGGGGGGGGGGVATAAKSELLQNLGPGGRFLAVRKRPNPAATTTSLVVPHRAAAVSREWEITLADSKDGAASLAVETPYAEYAPASFWLHAHAEEREASPPAAGVRPFLLMPLHTIMDEHYTVYFCKPANEAEARRPARHCV